MAGIETRKQVCQDGCICRRIWIQHDVCTSAFSFSNLLDGPSACDRGVLGDFWRNLKLLISPPTPFSNVMRGGVQSMVD
ncbi:hypothetical protein NEUTE2DRAFT_52035 [Neurospora tetrasperma FGSC 2509]|nr:hypothetical protein NEUTE2DRAFT_52035 [Neurospora tetrasperma FGSC 2509]